MLAMGWLACGDAATSDNDAATVDATPDDDLNNPFGITLAQLPAGDLAQAMETGDPGGVFFINAGQGASIGDLDGDGDLDIVLARIAESVIGGGPTLVLRNESPEGGPIRYSVDESIVVHTAAKNVLATGLADYDDDGDLDLFLACLDENLLLRNSGDGTFSDVTEQAGVAGTNLDASPGVVWADLNGDGLLDLYVINGVDPFTFTLRPNSFFLNLGDGTFADVSEETNTASFGAAQAALVADLDADGVVELYLGNDDLSSDGVPSERVWPSDQLYVRQSITDEGVPVFQDAAEARGVLTYRSSMGVALADYDADGDFDLYITDTGDNELYLLDAATQTYSNAAESFGVLAGRSAEQTQLVSWGASPLDLDRDGALELFVVHGAILPLSSYDENNPFPYGQLDIYYRQPSPGAPFVAITKSVGLPVHANLGETDKGIMGRGAYWGDLDRDGDDDLLLGAYADTFRLYENRTLSTGHYVRLRLRGTASSPDPIGAIVTVETDDGASITAQYARDGQPYGSGDAVLEIGLGTALPTAIHIAWPSGLEQTLSSIAADTEVVVREPDWLALSARAVTAGDPPPVLTYRAVDDDGAPLGSAGAGREVAVSRTDGLGVEVVDVGDGTYTAQLVHPGSTRRIRLLVSVDGSELRASPMLTYK
jgi:hypothetical protein